MCQSIVSGPLSVVRSPPSVVIPYLVRIATDHEVRRLWDNGPLTRDHGQLTNSVRSQLTTNDSLHFASHDHAPSGWWSGTSRSISHSATIALASSNQLQSTSRTGSNSAPANPNS